MTRRAFLGKAAAAGGLALGGGLGMGGCGAPTVERVGGKTVLDFWVFNETRQAWQENAWKMYRKQEKPDFEVRFLLLPTQQMHDKILIASQAGFGGPDIADIEITQFGRFIKGEPVFVDMRPELERRGVLEELFLPAATDPWSSGASIYGVGNELNTCLMSYRQDLYEKAGVSTPIETWEEYLGVLAVRREASRRARGHRSDGSSVVLRRARRPRRPHGHWLRARGVGPDGALAIVAGNSVEYLTVVLAAAQIGARYTLVNRHLAGPGIGYILDDCDPGLVVTDATLGAHRGIARRR